MQEGCSAYLATQPAREADILHIKVHTLHNLKTSSYECLGDFLGVLSLSIILLSKCCPLFCIYLFKSRSRHSPHKGAYTLLMEKLK